MASIAADLLSFHNVNQKARYRKLAAEAKTHFLYVAILYAAQTAEAVSIETVNQSVVIKQSPSHFDLKHEM